MNNSIVYKNHLFRIDETTNGVVIYNNMGFLMNCISLEEAKIKVNARERGDQLLYQLKKAVDIIREQERVGEILENKDRNFIGNDDRISGMKRLIEQIENVNE